MLQGSYILNFIVLFPLAIVSYALSYGNIPSLEELQDIKTWRLYLGHLYYNMIKRMAANGSFIGIQLKTIELLRL